MASVSVTPRTGKKGTTHHVRYRKGRLDPGVFCGALRTDDLAQRRARLVREWDAEGKDVRVEMMRLRDPGTVAAKAVTIAAWYEEWIGTQRLEEATLQNKRAHAARIMPLLGSMIPHEMKRRDVERWVTWMLEQPSRKGGTLQPAYVGNVKQTLSQVLSYAGVPRHLNPCNDVNAGRTVKKATVCPQWIDVLRARAELPTDAHREIMDLMLHGGLRHGEAMKLRAHSIDNARNEIIVQAETTKTKRMRVVPWLEFQPSWIPRVAGRDPEAVGCPGGQKAWAYHLTAACERAGVAHINPHLLRHMHVSVLYHEQRHGHRMGEPDMAARLGHSIAEMRETYAHVPPRDSYGDYPELH